MEYFVISAKFIPLKYYTLSSQLRRLTSFSVGCSGRRILSPGQIAVMQKWSIRTYMLVQRHDLGQYHTELLMTSLVCKVGLYYSSASINQLFNTKNGLLHFTL